jgi:hypothetical protein
MGCGVGHYPATGLCLSGKSNLSGDGIFYQFRPNFASRPVHHIGSARGKAGSQTDLTNSVALLLGGFATKAARGKAGRDLPGQDPRKVPGGDESGDAHGCRSTMLTVE